jgi:hypothetical protein
MMHPTILSAAMLGSHQEITKSSAMQAAVKQGALWASCMGFCAVHQLQLSIQTPSISSIAAEEMALSTVCSILARRDALLLQRGAFVRMALSRFSHALATLKSLETGTMSGNASYLWIRRLRS